mgnify:CR=1 FL=1
MLGNDEIDKELARFYDNLENYHKWIDVNEGELKKYFYQECNRYNLVSYGITCNEKGFSRLVEINRRYIKMQMEFIEEIRRLEAIKENKFSRQMGVLISDCVLSMRGELLFSPSQNLIFEIVYKMDFAKQYYSILLLAQFAGIDGNIVLIGGNGSGKSSLANALKGNDTENICVIPAQKNLYFSMNDMSMLSTRKSELVSLLLENNISKSKERDEYSYFNFQNNQFTKLIVAMKEQYTEYLIKCDEEDKRPSKDATIFGQLKKVYEVVFPEIKLCFESDAREYLNCIKHGEKYHVNALSEGEKAVIYYSISVLMSQNDSIIVVDEPETYLNPSQTNLLWDYLVKLRVDCQFIFITHSVDFVLGRSEAKIAWIKNFDYPNKWNFEFLNEDISLPKSLITEILGSKKPIAFCEGNDKSSLDYAVYRAILGKTYTIIPVGGHVEVIKNCEVLKSTPMQNLDAIGIVDGDNFSRQKIDLLHEKGIMVLPFNEIEMLLLEDEILTCTMKNIYPVNYIEKIDKFKTDFFETVEKRKNKIALINTTIQVNEFIAKEKIQESDSIEAIRDNIKRISEYDVNELYSEKIRQIEDVVRKKDYSQLLILCNLKKEISRGLANLLLDSDYEIKAIQQLQTNIELQKYMEEKYFHQI